MMDLVHHRDIISEGIFGGLIFDICSPAFRVLLPSTPKAISTHMKPQAKSVEFSPTKMFLTRNTESTDVLTQYLISKWGNELKRNPENTEAHLN